MAIKLYKLKFHFPLFAEIKNKLVSGKDIFFSSFSISLYSSANIFILGLFAGNEIVGSFIVADKIRLAMQIIQHNVSEAIFPYVTRLFSNSLKSGYKFIKSYSIYIIQFSIISSIIVFLFSSEIITTFSGMKYLESIKILKIIVWVPIVVVIRDTIGKQIMINVGLSKDYRIILVNMVIVSMIISLVIVPFFLAMGTAFIVLLTEIFVVIYMVIIFKKRLNIYILSRLL